MRITVDIPDESVSCLLPAGENSSHALLEDALIQAYREERIFGPQLMSALGLESRFDLEETLHKHFVWLDYTPEELESDRVEMEKRLASSSVLRETIMVVCDTTAINHLVQIGPEGVIPRLYDRVFVPTVVLAELQHRSAPAEVQKRVSLLTHWG